ncbi:ABC transporter six-transmembrane domain-containing protein [Erythrobacter mangrovi]|uniref:ABC transmembrane type-1 domain-containing protein n=1 Tax=Erythrobacter mangrovi TaxID=2739433 RepID=A0A7D3XV15_9SPHN|nr:ABC transporter six-transmembrane domain-containing protein [Erythrobacter mangrovi]QKG71016.1 hypothetical protein HQR01_06310 [Erythrobacter mangrovi]
MSQYEEQEHSSLDESSAEARSLAQKFRDKRLQIGLTYTALGIENIFDLIYPLLIGIAINGLLSGDHLSLVPLAGVWLAHIAVAALRQLYDTRLFSGIYVEVASGLAKRNVEEDGDLSRTSAHIVMTQDVVDFYEFDIPSIATVSISLLGAIALMFAYDVLSGLLVLCLLVPAGVVNRWLGKRSLRLNRILNNQYERQIDVLALRRHSAIQHHFGRVRSHRVGLSDAEAKSWSLLETVTLVVSLAVITRLASLPDASAGSIFAGVSYLLRIIAELDRVPELIQKIARLADIKRRLAASWAQL